MTQCDHVTTAGSGEKGLEMERSLIVFVVELETLVDRGLGGVDLIEPQALLDEICLFGDADAGRVDRTVGNVTIIAGT